MSTSRRRAVIQIDSPAIQAINRDNTIGSDAGPSAEETDDRPPLRASEGASCLAETADPRADSNERRRQEPAAYLAVTSKVAPAISRKKTVSFRTGLTSRLVIDKVTEIATNHHGDPDLVLRRFVREALSVLHAKIVAGEFNGFAPVSVRPQSLLALDTSTRIAPDDLDRLAAQVDPMQVFRQSAVIGFAVDQILTELHGR